MPYTKADVLRCLEAFLAEVKNRMAVSYAVEGTVPDPIVLMSELIEEGRQSLPEDAPTEYRP